MKHYHVTCSQIKLEAITSCLSIAILTAADAQTPEVEVHVCGLVEDHSMLLYSSLQLN